ncbi:ABC transporter substrate-binding protein [Paenibacillus sp. GYB003]|uniref:ABC transporter substrate-binding protein n=1 Tax=Paenibacillus sp. GYB003 TaxID=2994392 RepID=UPI002F964FBD
MKKAVIVSLNVLLGVSLLGCAGKEGVSEGGAKPEEKKEPVTLKLYLHGAALADNEFQRFFAEPVKKKYPHITLEFVKDKANGGTDPNDLIAAGTYPDIMYGSNTAVFAHKDLKWVADLSEYVKKEKLDLSGVNPAVLETLGMYADKPGEMIGLPFVMNYAALFYNKDIFDKFGVGYPKDLMTWDQVIGLAKQLTRQDGGIQYVGLDFTEPDRPGGQLSLPLVDAKTGNTVINSDGWKNIFNLLKQNYDIPGYIGPNNKWTYGLNAFLKDRNLAMLPNWSDGVIGAAEELFLKGQPLNYDIAALPNFQEELGKGREVDMHLLMLSNQSKHKDDAFKVMAYMLSEEIQTAVAKAGRFPVLNKPELEKSFGSDLGSLKGKNTAGIFKAKPRKMHDNPNEYDRSIVKPRLNDAAKAVALGQKDINTALRDAQETADKQIAEARKAKGK